MMCGSASWRSAAASCRSAGPPSARPRSWAGATRCASCSPPRSSARPRHCGSGWCRRWCPQGRTSSGPQTWRILSPSRPRWACRPPWPARAPDSVAARRGARLYRIAAAGHHRRSARFGIACGMTRCLRPVTTVPAALTPVQPLSASTRGSIRPRVWAQFGLIHPRPAPFTGSRPDRVRAGHGRWRTSVNVVSIVGKRVGATPRSAAGRSPPERSCACITACHYVVL